MDIMSDNSGEGLQFKADANVKSRVMVFHKVKETKNKVRYEETSGILETAYVPKALFGSPYPEKFEVTMRWV